MNIADHIRAGHYPADHLGRPLVPVESRISPTPWIATICTTDGPHGVIIGFGAGSSCEWAADGTPTRNDQGRLLPPIAKTVEVWRVEWWTIEAELPGCYVFLCKGNADAFAEGVKSQRRSACVRVTGPHQHEAPR